jgi:pilus assembly protein CpaE
MTKFPSILAPLLALAFAASGCSELTPRLDRQFGSSVRPPRRSRRWRPTWPHASAPPRQAMAAPAWPPTSATRTASSRPAPPAPALTIGPGQAMKGHSVKVTIVSLDAKSLEHIAALLRTRNPTHQIDKVLGKLDKLPPNSTPDVLVLDQPSIERGDLDAVERLGNVQPRIAFILLCRQHTPEFLLQAMRAGVREVLDFPAPPGCLYLAIERIEENAAARRRQRQGAGLHLVQGRQRRHLPRHQPGVRAGRQGDSRVALIDMNCSSATPRCSSPTKAAGHAADVAQQIHRLDPSFLCLEHAQHHAQLRRAGRAEDPARQRRSPSTWTPSSAGAPPVRLRRARRGPQPRRGQHPRARPCRHDLSRAADHPALHPRQQAPARRVPLARIPEGKIHLIVNRHDKGSENPRARTSSTRTAAIFTVPNNYDAAAASVNQGMPVLQLAPASPITRALQEFARRLAAPRRRPRRSGWLGRSLRRA